MEARRDRIPHGTKPADIPVELFERVQEVFDGLQKKKLRPEEFCQLRCHDRQGMDKEPRSVQPALLYRHDCQVDRVHRNRKLVTEQPWYEGGYRANVVAYAIAKLAHDVEEMHLAVDFGSIWRKQDVSEAFRQALVISAKACHEVLIDPPSGMSNVTEWAKQQACWSRISALRISWPGAFEDELISEEDQDENETDGERDQRLLNCIETQTIVVKAGGPFWRSVKEWGVQRRLLSPREAGVLDVAASFPGRMPSEKQSVIVIETLKKMHSQGCQIGRDLL
jgi:hypothetical protein